MILLVDDDPDDAELFRVAAAQAGISRPIRVAGSGIEALDVLVRERQVPELVLLDIKMPGLDGLEVLRRLRADPATADLPVIVLTSSDLESDRAEARRLGCREYVMKPSSFEGYVELAARIGSNLG